MDGLFEKLMHQSSIKSIFGKRKTEEASPKLIPQLSLFANSVVARCSKVLQVSTEELQLRFENELPDHLKNNSTYARNLLEYCCYQTLHVMTQRPDYLANKEFRRLSFDMMLAWEVPGIGNDSIKDTGTQNSPQSDDDEGSSIFYSNSMSTAIQVDKKKTVGPEAFARIAPACPIVADIITVDNLFNALTSASNSQLHFLVYDKYLGNLDKVIKASKSILGQPTNIELAEGEIILDTDGTSPTQPVFQHIGVSAWPGRLTLTNYALYFEPLRVGSYDKPIAYNLAMDLKQILKPELTGPLGARLFDKGVLYKSLSLAEPVVLEFPEFKGHSRRDYWLAISREVFYVHKFIRRFKLKSVPQLEALSKAMLGIFRYRAVREAFHILPSQYNTFLAFNLVEKLPGGDVILETLSARLELLNIYQPLKLDVSVKDPTKLNATKSSIGLAPISLISLSKLGFGMLKEEDAADELTFLAGDVCVGEVNPLQLALKQSKFNSGIAEAAQATVDQVKVEGLDTNMAVMKELLFPILEFGRRVHVWASWDDPLKSTSFLVLTSYVLFRGWINYIFASIVMVVAILMLWHRFCGKPLEAFQIVLPPSRSAVEQLIALQEAISQFESLIQEGNIVLLKLRAVVFSGIPAQTSYRVALLLVITAAMIAFLPLNYILMLVFWEAFTREMPLRKESSDKVIRRVRELWVRIPAAPVQIVKHKESKESKKKK
ncbi:hypothetical protein H6P81_017863 [Aristolochia fimbriata]|uniref:Uncharacterized protein n=1 Tax=Aristolochia fimbriata TaxID=158543 RepID=A0AAV7DZT6_ARIFI|nr:hypothetical protein H6P81_017863 [Aristolochia fimbriata]